ncbi:MAG: AbrB/MazE/SpoVT family DNA-binding domain-containing protein [Bryobacteraceae bacterium]|nr:AbrB/MazE/SpoVT family DNA-binding domain-containing protein [Bryobacteraceae bacterium]
MNRSTTSLAKWGSSLAVRIPKAILEAARLKPGDELEIELQDQTIIIQPAASKPTLEELLNGITPENCHPTIEWGQPVGKEVW